MAGNIYGYQGVHTPLESVTQGRYTLSDYTNMKTELTSRLIALENQGGFVPTNVEITGYLHMLPGGQGQGEIETTSSITGGSLYINQEAHVGNLVVDNSANFGGSIAFNGDITTLSSVNAANANISNTTSTYNLTCQNAGAFHSISANTTAAGQLPLALNGPLSGDTVYHYTSHVGSGEWNPLILQNQPSIISKGAGGQNTRSMVLTIWSNTAAGLQINPTNVITQSGNSKIELSASTGQISLTSTQCPTAVGFVLPATSDSTSKLATTQWVQSVVASSGSSVPNMVYFNADGFFAISTVFMDNIYRLAPLVQINFYFTSRIIGQRITILRDVIDLTSGNSFYWAAGSLPYRVYTLDGTVTNLSTSGPVAAISYTYAGQQKIRSVFIVLASSDINYSFDLIEIS